MSIEYILKIAADQGLTTLNLVEKEIKEVTLAFKDAATQAERMAQATRLQQLGGFKTAMMGATSAIQGTQTASANASMALLNLNYVIRDSPYFFNNFALGLLAVGNNLNPLIDSFGRLRKEALEKNIGTMEMLKKAMVGGAGISIAFSVVVTAIQAFVFSMSRAKKETKEMAEATGELKVEMDDVIKAVNQMRDSYKQDQTKDLATRQASDLERLRQLTVKRRALWFESMGLPSGDPRKAAIITEREDLKREIDFIVSLWAKVVDKQKESTKELKKQKDYLQDQAHVIETIRGMAFGRESGVRPSRPLFPGVGEGGSGFQRETRIGEAITEVNDNMQIAKTVADQMGQAIANAFMMGTFQLDRFYQALLATIAQMLIMKAITSALFGGIGAGTPAVSAGASAVNPLSFIPGIGWMFQKRSAPVIIGGEITMDSNKFVVSLKKANNSYSNNYEVGRGNIINL